MKSDLRTMLKCISTQQHFIRTIRKLFLIVFIILSGVSLQAKRLVANGMLSNLKKEKQQTVQLLSVDEEAKLFKKEVSEIASEMKSDKSTLSNVDKLSQQLARTLLHYETVKSRTSDFALKAEADYTQYMNLRKQYGKVVNENFIPKYEMAKENYKKDILANAPSTRISLQTLLSYRDKLCWTSSENRNIGTEADGLEKLMDVNEKFKENYNTTKEVLVKGGLDYPQANIEKMNKLRKLWVDNKLPSDNMDTKLEELSCLFHQNIYEDLKKKTAKIQTTDYSPEYINYFNSLVTAHVAMSKKALPGNCVGMDKFNELSKQVEARSKLINAQAGRQPLAEKPAQAASSSGNPVDFIEAAVFMDQSKTYTLRFAIHNNSTKNITNFKARLTCFSASGAATDLAFSSSAKASIMCKEIIYSDRDGGDRTIYPVNISAQTSKVKIEIYNVTFDDGSQWNAPSGKGIFFTGNVIRPEQY